MPTIARALYRFGPFRVDPDKKLLLRDGETVAITPKAIETLVILLRNAGELVSREQMIEELWPDSFVEEANLSQNIFMLRKALGDTPEDRRYIVTLPGRGYRFVGHVETLPAEGDDNAVDPMVPVSDTAGLETIDHKRGWTAIWIYAVAIIAGVVAGAIVSLFTGKPKAIALSEKDAVLICDFNNTTGDAVFDDTLRQGMAVQLAQSPMLTLVSEDRIERTLGLMGKPAGTRVTPDIARQVCQRARAAVLLEGSIARLGSRYVVGMQARSCRDGEILDEEQEQALRKEDVLKAVTQIAVRFRTRIGESRPAIALHDTPLAEATTPSLDALKAYSLGLRKIASESDSAALPFFQRAIEIDPEFAMAYALEGRVYGDLGEAAASSDSTARAYQLRNRASDRERFWITTAYYMQVTENLEKAKQTCAVWDQSYPNDIFPHMFLAGVIDPVLGRHEDAIEHANRAITIDPDFGVLYYDLAIRNAALGRMQQAEEALQAANARGLQTPDVQLAAYDVAFLRHDSTAIDHIEHAARQSPLALEYVLQHKASGLAYLGKLREAARTMDMDSDIARRSGEKEAIALNFAGQAVWEALAGEAPDAVRHANTALSFTNDRAVQYGAALAMAISGDSARAQELASDLEKRFPEDTSVQISYLPVLRAQLALNQRDSAKAVDVLESAIPYEFGTPRSAIHGNFGALYPAYLRGEAYLAAHQGAQAAAEFQKILEHSGIVGSDPMGAIAMLKVARAFSIQGDTAKTKKAYADFLALWKDADPNVPLLRRARSEFATIQ